MSWRRGEGVGGGGVVRMGSGAEEGRQEGGCEGRNRGQVLKQITKKIAKRNYIPIVSANFFRLGRINSFATRSLTHTNPTKQSGSFRLPVPWRQKERVVERAE